MYRHLNCTVSKNKSMNYFKKFGILAYPSTLTGWLITCLAIGFLIICWYSLKACITDVTTLLKHECFWMITVSIVWYVIAIICSKNKQN